MLPQGFAFDRKEEVILDREKLPTDGEGLRYLLLDLYDEYQRQQETHQQQIQRYESNIEQLMETVRWLRRQHFGPKSEKDPSNGKQYRRTY